MLILRFAFAVVSVDDDNIDDDDNDDDNEDDDEADNDWKLTMTMKTTSTSQCNRKSICRLTSLSTKIEIL